MSTKRKDIYLFKINKLLFFPLLILLADLANFKQFNLNTCLADYHEEKHESYHDRPSIMAINPRTHQLGSTWENFKWTLIDAISMFLEIYPDREIYFVARDSEYLFDFAQLMLNDSLQRRKKIHLINVSRDNMDDPNLSKYLAQEGISAQALAQGKKILIIDTGYKGTISASISDLFPPEDRHKKVFMDLFYLSNQQNRILVNKN